MAVPLPTINGTYYGYVWMTYQGLKTGSVFTFRDLLGESDPANDAAKAQYIADGLATSWAANMSARYPNGTTGVDSRVYALGHPLVPPAFGHASGSGGGGTTVAAVSTAAVIRHSVFRRGRGSQSHTAISPLLKGEITDDGLSVTPAFITNVTSDFGDFIGGVQAAYTTATGGSEVDYVQLSKRLATTFQITGSVVESLLGTERSRTPRP